MSDTKLCRECKWSRPDPQGDWRLECHHPKMIAADSDALSASKPRGTSCYCARQYEPWFFSSLFNTCGKAGRLWEPKP